MTVERRRVSEQAQTFIQPTSRKSFRGSARQLAIATIPCPASSPDPRQESWSPCRTPGPTRGRPNQPCRLSDRRDHGPAAGQAAAQGYETAEVSTSQHAEGRVQRADPTRTPTGSETIVMTETERTVAPSRNLRPPTASRCVASRRCAQGRPRPRVPAGQSK